MKQTSNQLLLLDTHIWLWVAKRDAYKRLSASCCKAIEQASNNGKLAVSVISVWEIGMLEAKGRIRLSKACLDWVQEALSASGLQLISLSPEIAIESSHLPGEIHGDPADRILAATARIYDAVLITQDSKLIEYGKQHYLSVLSG